MELLRLFYRTSASSQYESPTSGNIESGFDTIFFPGRIRPRHALKALERGLVDNSIVGTDIGNICSVANSYLKFKYVKIAIVYPALVHAGSRWMSQICGKEHKHTLDRL